MSTSNVSLGWGFGAAAVSTVFFGSNFVPVKKIETGDGVFFQFIMCCAILLVGLVVHALRNFPRFYPLAMVGGAMWTLGNLCVVPIIKTIGLGLGMLLWALTNMLCGWASGRFGLFGVKKDVPPGSVVNFIGVALCAVSGIFYVFVKTNVSRTRQEPSGYLSLDDGMLNLAGTQSSTPQLEMEPETGTETPQQPDIFDHWSPGKKRFVGCFLAVFAGAIFGFSFTPYLYVVNNYKNASQNGLDYVFAQFVGTYAMSAAAMMVYAAYKQNRPSLYPSAVLPGIASGVMWGIADAAWFVATGALGEAISFPIITTAPPIIANLWTIILFKEITGKKNLLICGIGFLISCGGVAMIVVSKT